MFSGPYSSRSWDNCSIHSQTSYGREGIVIMIDFTLSGFLSRRLYLHHLNIFFGLRWHRIMLISQRWLLLTICTPLLRWKLSSVAYKPLPFSKNRYLNSNTIFQSSISIHRFSYDSLWADIFADLGFPVNIWCFKFPPLCSHWLSAFLRVNSCVGIFECSCCEPEWYEIFCVIQV